MRSISDCSADSGTEPKDHALNRLRNVLYFRLRYPWVKHGDNVHVKWSTRMWSPHKQITIGNNVGIGFNCLFQCDIEIGNSVLIASNVALVGSDDHRYDVVGQTMWASGRRDSRRIVIEDDVWLGHGAIILSGSTIGRGSIIGAGAVIHGDVPRYSIMVPQKARLLKKRFTDEQVVLHERELQTRSDR